MNGLLIGVLVYVLAQFAIGMLVSRRVRTESDYVLAGRQLGWFVAAFSIFATWFGAETIVGAAGTIYSDGLSGAAADPFGYGACLILMGMFFAAPLWRRGLVTFADLFRERYSSGVERLVVMLLVPTSVMWAAAQIRAFGQVVSASSDLEISIAITSAAIFVVMYTVAGGLLADAITDLIQGIAVIVGLIVLLVSVVNSAGGIDAAVAYVDTTRLSLFGADDTSGWQVLENWAVPICGSVLAVELISRVLGCRSASVAQRAALLGGGIYLAVGLIPVFLGLVGPALVPALADGEQVIPQLAQQYLGTFMYVVFAGALISAILSTVDSALLASASIISHNLVVPMRPRWRERDKVRAARAAVIILGLAAYALALYADGVYELVQTASAFGSAGVFVTGVFALYTRIGDASSAYAALSAGMVVWIAGAYVLEWQTPYLASLGAAFAAYVTVAMIRATASRPVRG